jgi:FKBP-type peptidyl-prolyl cis-trans isomerase
MISTFGSILKKLSWAFAIGAMLICPFAHATPADDLAKEKELSQAYLHEMAMEPNTQVMDSGIILRPIFESGSNQFAKVTDTVKVAYHLVDREGKVVDESITSDALAVFPLNKLIKCWQIAIPKISIGSFYKISCPSDVAYGDKGAGDGAIKPGAALTFRLTVYGVQ